MVMPASPPAKGPVVRPPARMVDNCGKYLTGDAVGLNDSQFGPVVLVALALLFAPDVVELSFCSQLYVSASPSASVALWSKVK